MVNYHQLQLGNVSNFTIMIIENYHQRDDELDHIAKSLLQQSNHYTDELDHKHNLQCMTYVTSGI